MMHTCKSGWLTIAAVLVLALSTAACEDQPLDRAGGTATTDGRTLTVATFGDAPDQDLLAWAGLVDEFSDGSLTIVFENQWRMGEPTFETGMIEDVLEEEVDLAWVGTRSLDRVGVDSFQALMAPMLIDSQALQGKVFEEGLPNEMLGGLAEIDLVGIGVAPGPLRKVLGVDKPLLGPQDYTGLVVGMQDSDVAAATLEALGATPRKAPTGASLDGLDGYEQQLSSILGNHYENHAGYVTANVTLWPRPLVLVMNRNKFDSLSTDDQQVLREAADEALPTTLESPTTDDVAVPALCEGGLQFATASDSEISELEAALGPVYDELMTQPQTASYIETIRRLKAELGAPPDSPSCGDPVPAEEAPAGSVIPEGTYTTTLDDSDWASWELGGSAGRWSLVIADGVMRTFDPKGEPGGAGKFTVFRDRVEVTMAPDTFTMTWTVSGDELRFAEFDFGSCGDCDPYEIVFGSHPWTLEDEG